METHCDALHRLGISLAKSYHRLAEAKGDLTEAANIFEQISILHTSIGKHREDCSMCEASMRLFTRECRSIGLLTTYSSRNLSKLLGDIVESATSRYSIVSREI